MNRQELEHYARELANELNRLEELGISVSTRYQISLIAAKGNSVAVRKLSPNGTLWSVTEDTEEWS